MGEIAALAIYTSNGGSSWTSATLPSGASGVAGFTGVSCAAGTTTCVTVGFNSTNNDDSTFLSSNGGVTWTTGGSLTNASAGFAQFSISCSTATTCVAAGYYFESGNNVSASYYTINGGSSWTISTLPSGIGTLNSVSCAPTTTTCHEAWGTATNSSALVITSVDGGISWTTDTMPSYSSLLFSIACGSPTACVAGGPGEMDETTTGSVGCTLVTSSPINGVAKGLSCSSASNCAAVGTSFSTSNPLGLITINGGSNWSKSTFPTGVNGLGPISCGSTANCSVIGLDSDGNNFILYTTNGGIAWATATIPSGITLINALSCSTSTVCAAFSCSSSGPSGLYSTNGGATWTATSIPTNTYGLINGISWVFGTSTCIAIVQTTSNTINSVVSSNGGASWSNTGSISAAFFGNSISCESSSNCLAVVQKF